MKQGYTFTWPPGEQPFMINKDGMRIDLHSKDDIPYLIPGEGSEPHKKRLATDIHNLINQKVLVADVPAMKLSMEMMGKLLMRKGKMME